MTATPRQGLERLLRPGATEDLDDLARRRGVQLLTVFGSAIRPAGEPRDLDVAVAFDPSVEPDLLAVYEDLVGLTGVADLDLMDLGRAGVVARERALVGSVAVYERSRGDLARAQIAAVTQRMDTDWLRRLDLELMAG